MDPEEFIEAVRTERKTELSRLGSSKALYALTEGAMEPEAVLAAMADDHHAAAERYEGWAGDGSAADLFETAATAERDASDTVIGKLDGHDPADPAWYDAVGGGTTVERLGAFVGRTLVATAHRSQATGFFTGQADPGTARTFRDRRGTLEDHVDAGVDALADVCGDETDWETARGAASAVVEAAYDDYFATLEELGVNPKPVC